MIRHNLAIDPRIFHSELVSSLGDSAPSLRTVYRWVERFKTDQSSTKDIHRTGRPITATSKQNIHRVRVLTEDNPRIGLNYL